MSTFPSADRRGTFRLALLAALLSLAAGCGLGMDNADRLERARKAFAAGEHRAVVIDTRNILKEEPDNREARLLLGRSSLALNDAATAEKELRRAVGLGEELAAVAVDLGRAMLALRQHEALLAELGPELARTEEDRLSILRMRGESLLALDRPVDARAAYEEVLAAHADDLPALLGLASSYAAEARYTEARATIGRALAIDASHAPARIASGSLFLATGKPKSAAEEFRTAADLAAAASNRDDEITALSGLIEARLGERDVAAAKETLGRLEKLVPDDLRTVYLRARIAFLEEDYELAQRELQRVLAVAPESQPAEFLMGAVQLQRGNLGQAEMYLSSVVAASPGNVDARKLLAEIRLRQHRADEAAAILRPLLEAETADLGTLNLAVRASLEAGEVDDAVGHLRHALAADPDNADIRLDLVAALLAAGEVNEAEALLAEPADSDANAYRRALLTVLAPLRRGDPTTALAEAMAMAERWPQDARARNLIGGIALELENADLARESFLTARDLAPDDITAYLNLARLDVERGDFAAARRQYEAAMARRPDSADLMVGLAQLEARAENADAAVRWLQAARAADPAALAPRLLLARWYVGRSEFEAAEAAAAEAVALAAGNAEAHNLLGLALEGQGKSAAARESFATAVRLAPEQGAFRINKARAQAAAGDLEAAERTLLGTGDVDLGDLRTAVLAATLKARQGDTRAALGIARGLQGRHPDSPVPLALEAELLATEGEYQKAAAVYDRALALAGDDSRLALRAYRVRRTGGLPAAEQPLVDYLEERPLDADLRVMLAQHYQAAGQSARAIAEYRRALEIEPDHFVALNNLAWEYFVTEDPRAEETARRAFERSPRNGAVADTLGWIQVQKGKLEEGIATLRKAAALADGNVDVKYHLAAGLAAAGEPEEARRLLEELVAANPGARVREDAERLLESLPPLAGDGG